jgi:hypothetical protein
MNENLSCVTEGVGGEYYVQGRSLRLQLLSEPQMDNVWQACMQNSVGNLELFKQIYGRVPSSAPEFSTIIQRPPPSCIKTTVFRFSERYTGRSIGWAVIALRSRETISTTPPHSAIFTPIEGTDACGRNMEAVYLLWQYAITKPGYDVIDTRMASRSFYGLSEGMYGFDVIEVAKRQLRIETTQTSDLYRMTKEKWPALMAAGAAYMCVRDATAGDSD